MFSFCDALHERKKKKRKQTLKSAQYGWKSSLMDRNVAYVTIRSHKDLR